MKKKNRYCRPDGPNGPNETGIEFLRWAVGLFDACSESAIDRLPPVELIDIALAQSRSGWDFYPDQWTTSQLRAALKYGEPPMFCIHCEGPCQPHHGTLRPSSDTDIVCLNKLCTSRWTRWVEYQKSVFRRSLPQKKESA